MSHRNKKIIVSILNIIVYLGIVALMLLGSNGDPLTLQVFLLYTIIFALFVLG